uniref:Retrotransposon protein, putative, Ty1-copia subclass n=1 Tax=Tanacetum cinerariifolium TaxID=118510 RepID=A0A699GKJ8_TANCI|nr:retrotransposon protein, putative, Ty1-copia subclass [Tanacetum cinerariifolium]
MSTENGVNSLAPNHAHNSNFSLLLVLGRERLTGPNYMDWMRNLRFTLRYENKEYVLDEKIPTIDDDSTQEEIESHQKHYDDANKVSCIMTSSMRPKLQKTFENPWAYKMNQQLKEMFQAKAIKERLDVVKSLMKKTSIIELYSLLQTTEQGIKKIVVPFTLAALVLTVDHNAKKRKTSHFNRKGKATKGKSDCGSKRKAESEIAPTSDPKKAVCFYCNTKGHWKLCALVSNEQEKDSIIELHSLLQTTEQGIKKIDLPSTSAALVMTVDHNAKKRKTSHSNWKGKATKGKSDRGSKRKAESEITPTSDPKEAGLKESRRLKHGEFNLVMENRKIMHVIRIGNNTSNKVLGYALETTAHILNLVPTKKVSNTPFEMWKGKRPSLGHIKIWGFEVYVRREAQDKLEARFEKCPFVGYKDYVVCSSRGVFHEREMISKEDSVSKIDLEEIQESSDKEPIVNTDTKQEVVTPVKPDDISLPIRKTSGRVSKPPQFYYGFHIKEDKISDSTLSELDELLTTRKRWKALRMLSGRIHFLKDPGFHASVGLRDPFDDLCYRDRSKRLIGISQNTYLDKILKRFKIENSKKGNLPLHHGIKIRKDLCPKTDEELDRMSRVPYASVVGSIMYAMTCTRPDVSFALSMLSRHHQNPYEGHWTAVNNILKYLRNTKDGFLVYGGEEELRVTGYYDASWQTNKDDSHSQSSWTKVETPPDSPPITVADPDNQSMWPSTRIVALTSSFAIIQVSISNNFLIKGTHMQMIRDNQFDGRIRSDTHRHVADFLEISNLFQYGENQEEAVKLRTFLFSLSGEAKTWLNELDEGTITSHGLTKVMVIQTFYRGLDDPTQEILDAEGIFLYKTPNKAFKILEDKVNVKAIKEEEINSIPTVPNPKPINFNSPTVSPFLKDYTVHIIYTNVKTFVDDVLPNLVGDKELKSSDVIGNGSMTKKKIKKDDMGFSKPQNIESNKEVRPLGILSLGPYKPTTILVQTVAATDDSLAILEHTTVETPMNMSPENKAHFQAKKEAIHLILTGIRDKIYSTVDACQTVQEMWEAIERLQQEELALIAKYFKKIYKPTNNNLRTSSNLRNKNVDTTLRYKNDNQSGQFGNQRTVNVAGARENNAESQKGLKTLYHKEKMLLCKQAEQGVSLQAELYDWQADTDEEIDEQEFEAHYSYMAKIQEVPTADSGTDSEPLESIQNDIGYNVFANDLQHSEQSESISNTCLVETDDSNVIPNSLDM